MRCCGPRRHNEAGSMNFHQLIQQFGVRDAVDIVAVALIIYGILNLIKDTRAMQMVYGLLGLALHGVKGPRSTYSGGVTVKGLLTAQLLSSFRSDTWRRQSA